ncbi:hypothetical protein [Croceibacter atlanticus]|uniref:hypothetical protein n=1 Tax=Croceibacter atlanticus TaxID=313588 RepID=UPI0024BA6C1E|nr:hypothetical protein [Croceibacter atlanticus]WSP33517.1 hypothetical protein VVL01_08815 [Croceibacter atlanticus]
MRKGINPTKGGKLIQTKACDHRIIIPLHIPHENDYYKDAYNIFYMCLTSLYKTTITGIKISVVSNKCCTAINDRLLKLYKEDNIDELIIEKEGIGKLNSVLKALRTAEERLITITDADVLFLNGWEEAVIRIFNEFPKAGSVTPLPVFRKHFNLTHNIWLDNIFSKRLKFTKVPDPIAMAKFANSIGWPRLDLKYKDVMLTLESEKGHKAMVGGSHFVATYKREVFKKAPKINTKWLIEGNSEHDYLDLPVLKSGGYRLSTEYNFAYHIGNSLEDFYENVYSNLAVSQNEKLKLNLKELQPSNALYQNICKILEKLLAKKSFKNIVLKYKGLTKEQLPHF